METIGRAWRVFIFAYLLLWFIGSLWLLAVLGSGTLRGTLLGVNMETYGGYAIFGFAGALGGALYSLRLFHQYYQELTGKWVFWYSMRPVLCFGSAIITIILFESGILLLQVGDSMAAKVSVAFLTGYGYGKFMEKLRALTETFFNGAGTGTPGDGTAPPPK